MSSKENETAMAAPLIAIVGSMDETRTYDPPLIRPADARAACEQLGRELATHNCRIVVYSSEPGFIECHIVRGYVASQRALPGSIQVRYPYDAGIAFPELETHPDAFDVRPDTSPDWEVSFYRSLADTDAVVVIGGGQSTLITGLIAIAYRLPVLAVAVFGGNARKVWETLAREKGWASSEEISAMAHDWRHESAARLVDALLAGLRRRKEEEQAREARLVAFRRRATVSSLVAAVLLLVAVATVPISWDWDPGSEGALTALMLAPLLAGAAGSIIRVVTGAGRDWTKTAVLGLAAGGIAFLLFIAAQLAATPEILDTDGSRRLLLFGLPMSFIAGLTFDVVYEKLKRTDVVATSVVQAQMGDSRD